MLLGDRVYSFKKGNAVDNALDFSKRSSFVREIMLEKIYPTRIILPMKQHYGDPSVPAVEVGEHVLIGQCVGAPEPGSFAVPIHSGISGDVSAIDKITLPNGETSVAVFIESDRKRSFHPSVYPRNDVNISASAVKGIIKSAGIVGMGGEGIPTIAKINRAKRLGVDELLVNCLQSEPYANSDLYRIVEASDYLVMGAVALAGACGVRKISFLIADDRKDETEAIRSAMERTCDKYSGYSFDIKFFKDRFPQGYYRMIARALYDMELSERDTLEESCGAVLFNCSTVHACWEAISDNIPLINRVITVTGDNMIGRNILAPIGTPVSELLNTINGKSETGNRIIWGNCLTGLELNDPDNTPIIKTTSAVTVIRNYEKIRTECIRCGRCSDACPMGLEPGTVAGFLQAKMYLEAEYEGARKCIACGACSYTCPAGLNLTGTIASYSASERKRRQHSFVTSGKIDIGAVSLLEVFEDESADQKENNPDEIMLPFEGGKSV